MTHDIPLTLTTDLSEYLTGKQPLSVSIGPGGEAVLLVVGEAIASDGHVRAWRTEVSGAHAFAVDGHRVLFFGGYRSQRARCVLGELQDGVVAGMVECRLTSPWSAHAG